MTLRFRLFVIPVVFALAGCAGSVEWDKCVPDVCGLSDGTLTMSPGGMSTVTATLLVEGASEDTYTLSVQANGSSDVTGTISPQSAEVLDGVPLKASVIISVDAAAISGRKSVLIEATSSDGSHSAGTAVNVNVP